MRKLYNVNGWGGSHSVTVNFPTTKKAWFRMSGCKFEFEVCSLSQDDTHLFDNDWIIKATCDDEEMEFFGDDQAYQYAEANNLVNAIDEAVKTLIAYIGNRY